MMAADPDWHRRFFTNATQSSCFHLHAEAVMTVDAVHVGYLCPDCDAVLDADWDGVRQALESHVAAVMIAAGFDPADAITAVGHPAAVCPSRVEITALRDDAARYVHGNCQPEEAHR